MRLSDAVGLARAPVQSTLDRTGRGPCYIKLSLGSKDGCNYRILATPPSQHAPFWLPSTSAAILRPMAAMAVSQPSARPHPQDGCHTAVAATAARRDEPGPITLFRTAAASRREPTGELGAAALDRAASEARAAADDQPTWQLQGANVADLAGYRPSRSKKKVRLKRHRTLSLIRPFFIHLD